MATHIFHSLIQFLQRIFDRFRCLNCDNSLLQFFPCFLLIIVGQRRFNCIKHNMIDIEIEKIKLRITQMSDNSRKNQKKEEETFRSYDLFELFWQQNTAKIQR